MRYRKLGKTGLMVSEISFGTIPILEGAVPVLPQYYNLNMQQALEVMTAAFKWGCNLFDTAIVPEYGDAEIKLGHFARHIGRDHIIISDKARCFDGNDMFQAVETSIRNMGTHPDIYFVHQVDPEHEDQTFRKDGAVDALVELKKQGKIKYVGIASHYYDILLRGARDSRVDVLQGSGNILERGMIDRVEEDNLFRKKGFILNKVYGAGILLNHFSPYELVNSVLSYPISTALIGLGTLAQVQVIMASVSYDYKRMTFIDVMAVLEKSFTPISCDRCQKCVCSYGFDISRMFRQYNYYFLGKDQWALKKLKLDMKKIELQCSRCGQPICIQSCPKNLHIPTIILKVFGLIRAHG